MTAPPGTEAIFDALQANRLSVAVDRRKARRAVTLRRDPAGRFIAMPSRWVFRAVAGGVGASLALSLYFLLTWTPLLVIICFLISRLLLMIWDALAMRLIRTVALADPAFLQLGLESRLLTLIPTETATSVELEATGAHYVLVTLLLPERLLPVLADLAQRWGVSLQVQKADAAPPS